MPGILPSAGHRLGGWASDASPCKNCNGDSNLLPRCSRCVLWYRLGHHDRPGGGPVRLSEQLPFCSHGLPHHTQQGKSAGRRILRCHRGRQEQCTPCSTHPATTAHSTGPLQGATTRMESEEASVMSASAPLGERPGVPEMERPSRIASGGRRKGSISPLDTHRGECSSLVCHRWVAKNSCHNSQPEHPDPRTHATCTALHTALRKAQPAQFLETLAGKGPPGPAEHFSR